MMPVRLVRAELWAAVSCACLAGWGLPQAARAQAAAPQTLPEPEFVYRFQPRDTLIGLSRRLLLQPQRWPELQQRNRIANPLTIRPDTPVRIPYAWLKLGAGTARVQSVTGTVTRAGNPVTAGEVLPEGALIETGADGAVSLAFANGSIATLQKNSVLRLEHLRQVDGVAEGHSAGLRLESGRIETVVPPRRDVGRFEIVTPVAVSAVRGTRFRAGFDPADGDALTETTEGTVGVASADDAVAVPAGFGTRVAADGAVLPPVALLPAPDLSAVPQTNTQPVLQVRLQPVGGAASYRIQLAGDADFHAIHFDGESPTGEADIAALPEGDYWLRARAIDANGIEGADEVRQVLQRPLPVAPALVLPAADARLAGTPDHEWAPVTGAASFRLQIARDAQFVELIAERETGATRLSVADLPASRYFWRVAGIDGQGRQGEWSPPGTYALRPPAPAIEPPVILGRELQLHWTAWPDATYRLQISRDARFRDILVDARSDTASLTLRKPVAGTYHARVQILDPQGGEDPFGEARSIDIGLPSWLKIALSATVLLPLLL